MQLEPDWTMINVTPEIIEQQLKDFEFNGPGFYLTQEDTLLIVPSECHQTKDDSQPIKVITRKTIWDSVWPSVTLFDVYVYNSSFNHLLFSVIRTAPVRLDKRPL